jgi:hypothetical protein
MPRRELNDRFQSHIRQAQLRRRIGATILGLCLLFSAVVAIQKAQAFFAARAVVSNAATFAYGGASDAFARLGAQTRNILTSSGGNIAPEAQLAASSQSGIGNILFRLVCTIFRNCPEDSAAAIATEQRPQPQKPNSYPATSSENVKTAGFAPAAGGATASTFAVSIDAPSPLSNAPIQQTIVQQPVIERVRETVRTVVESGINAADIDERMQALQQSVQSQIAALAAASHGESQTIYQTVGMVGRIEELSNTKLHTPTSIDIRELVRTHSA